VTVVTTAALARTACILALSLAARVDGARADDRLVHSGRIVIASPSTGVCVVETGARTHLLLLTSDAVVLASDAPISLSALQTGDLVQWRGAGASMDVVDELVVRSRTREAS
jgi:hypothetical protein